MASKVEFNRLLYKIAQKLSDEEIDSLVVIEGLPVAYKGKPQFTVLEQMVLQDTISESKPEKLAEVLKGINRMDLAKEAKDFSRTAKRSKKKHRGHAVQSDEQVLRVSIAANSEVALVQTNILLAQLDRLTEAMTEASHELRGREREMDLVCKAKQQIESAERLLETLYRNSGIRVSESDSTQSLSSSASDEEVHPLAKARFMDTILKGDAVAQPRKPIQETRSTSTTPSWTDTSGEGIYEEVDDKPTQVATTGEKKQNRPKPPTKPKPVGRSSTIQPRGAEIERKKMQSSTLPQPKKQPILPPLARLRSKQTTQGESTRNPITKSSSNSGLAYFPTGYVEVDEDFTGSTNYTGTGTGDSGFGDGALLCRIPLLPMAPQLESSNGGYESVRPSYYKTLNKETVEAVAYEVPQTPVYMNSFSKK